jgi:CubicO group peptidase (beta-lactamase class C family)
MQERIDLVVDQALAEKRVTGTVVLVSRNGEPVYSRAAGFADREAEKPTGFDTIFRLASVTKPITAATALALVDHGKLPLDSLVRDFLPYFTPKMENGEVPDIRIRDLLTHTAGFTYDATPPGKYPEDQRVDEGLSLGGLDFKANFTRLAAVPLTYRPATQWAYSTAIDVLGAVIATIEASSLDAAMRRYITGPLGMNDTGFSVSDMERLATPYADASPEPVRMQSPHTVVSPDGWALHFNPSRLFNPAAYQSGGGGAVGTAGDMMKLFEAIRQGGSPILKPETAAAAMVNQIGDIPRRPGDEGLRFCFLGSVVEDETISVKKLPNRSVHWGGVYGNSWAIDPASGTTIVIMTNNAVEGCMGRFPEDIYDAVYGN